MLFCLSYIVCKKDKYIYIQLSVSIRYFRLKTKHNDKLYLAMFILAPLLFWNKLIISQISVLAIINNVGTTMKQIVSW